MAKRIVMLSLLIGLASLIVLLLYLRTKESTPASRKVERTLIEVIDKRVKAIEVPFLVVDLRFSEDNLFVLNASDMQIVKLDDEGRIITTWGKKGSGPGEFRFITGWDVDSNGVYGIDSRKLAVIEFDLTGRVSSEYSIHTYFVRAFRITPGRYVLRTVVAGTAKRLTFISRAFPGQQVDTLELKLPSVEHDMALDGAFVKDSWGRNFYICQLFGYFVCFDSSGKFLYGKKTIDQTPPPAILETGSSARLDPKARPINYSGTTSKEHLYVLSRAGDITSGSFVDIYRKQDGSYKGSFVIPDYKGEKSLAIAINKSMLLTIQGTAIVKYSLLAH